MRWANHPRREIGGPNLRIHEPGIVFKAAVIRGLIGEDEERHARVTPLALHELALNQAPGRGWAGRGRTPGDAMDCAGLGFQASHQLGRHRFQHGATPGGQGIGRIASDFTRHLTVPTGKPVQDEAP